MGEGFRTSHADYSSIPKIATMAFETKAKIATFGGSLLKLSHSSTTTSTPMALNVFLPPGASASKPAPLLIYLSGLTCTPDNVTEKGFLHVHASKAPWDKNYKMESYITKELPETLFKEFKELDKGRVSISGHSMGGHGALTLFLKNPGQYKSVSAWAPIANPTKCPWGEKAFGGYIGEDKKDEWVKHDATELVKGWKGDLPALIDVGTGDNFYKQGQLLPENFEKAVKDAGINGVKVRYHDDYDHSYFFISTFGEDHVKHAAKALGLL